MSIKILDCTLRDGGYINNWEFGKKVIRNLIAKLSKSNVEIIECGFLKKNADNDNQSLFNSVSSIKNYLSTPTLAMYVAMIAYGDIDIVDIEPCDGNSVTGIRLTFHEEDIEGAFCFAGQLAEKGYKVFIQPVGTAAYTDQALLNLIDKVNRMNPYAFYLVDTLGTMYKKDLLRMFYLIDNNLNPEIKIGFHSHNNLQLSFSNAQELILMHSERDIIIDSSVFGMGRGAGNLCTELLTQYINENMENRYDTVSILEIMDEYIIPIYSHQPWGYSAPYYLAAVNGCHPNYASYLMNRQVLCIRDINSIIKSIPDEERFIYNADLVSELYLNYQKYHVDDTDAVRRIAGLCMGREILILAPGKSLVTKQDTIKEYIRENNPVIFAINHVPEIYQYDMVFISNLKRFRDMDDMVSRLQDKLICTSNITTDNALCVVNYASYLNNEDAIVDNAGLMLINLLIKSGAKKLVLAGYDGFHYSRNDYYSENMLTGVPYEKQLQINEAIIGYFKKIQRDTDIKFITPTIYDGRGDNV